MILTGRQFAAARELLKWSQDDLAEAAGVSRRTVARCEMGEPVNDVTILSLRTALEERGIRFLNGGNPGVQLFPSLARRRSPSDAASDKPDSP